MLISIFRVSFGKKLSQCQINNLTRKQIKKATKNQLIQFALKLQNNIITKQAELINDNNEFREKLNIIDSNFDDVKKENEILKSKVSVVAKTLLNFSTNYKTMNEKYRNGEEYRQAGTILLSRMYRNSRCSE